MSAGKIGTNLGDTVPDFKADSTQGRIEWHKFIEGTWAVLFSHPADYTPVCTTELGTMASIIPEFEKRGMKVVALSCNDVKSHEGWVKDIEATSYSKGSPIAYPIIADPNRDIANLYKMVDPEEKNAKGLPMTCRAVFVIGPDKKLKLSLLYPATTGCNFPEILRAIDSLQLTMNHKVATPANWESGDKCMVLPTLTDDQATENFGSFDVVEVPSEKRYMRLTADPSGATKGFIGQKCIMTLVGVASGALLGFVGGRLSKEKSSG